MEAKMDEYILKIIISTVIGYLFGRFGGNRKLLE